MSKIKLALLSGGISGEREVSLKTGEQIYEALDKEKYEVFRYDTKTDLKQFVGDAFDGKFDVVFPALHGEFGEDGRLQGMLDMIGLSYVFSGCLPSALAMNKYKSKVLAHEVGLTVASNIIVERGAKMSSEGMIDILDLPIVIKPLESGSSVGMSIVKTKEELESGILKSFEYGDTLLLEKFIKGREFTVSVTGEREEAKALPAIEIIPKVADFYDYEAKYTNGGSEYVCPADISKELTELMQKQSLKMYKSLGCKDVARCDFILSKEDNKIYFLEINTIPGMTATSLAPRAAKASGLTFKEFLNVLIDGNTK